MAALGLLPFDINLNPDPLAAPIWLRRIAVVYSNVIDRPDFSPSQLGRQIRACHTGTFWCEGHYRRTGDPAVQHICDVRGYVEWLGLGNDAQCAAWLHDTVEDSGQVSTPDIYRHFGHNIGRLVEAVTCVKLQSKQQTLERYIRQLVEGSMEDAQVGALKLSDTCANSRTIEGTNDTAWSAGWMQKAATTINHALAGPCREQVRLRLPAHFDRYEALLMDTVRNLRNEYVKVGDPDQLGFAAELIVRPR
ncbi:MAG: GTP pyrophosphokinase rsh [bacterium ADurb.Bin212]|nr:MAG: GTP pyrophosphokinase rsh [bacterium ADurb.Bin212]